MATGANPRAGIWLRRQLCGRDERPLEPATGAHQLCRREERMQVGLVLNRRLGDGFRAIEVSPRFVVAWVDAQPRGMIWASAHAPDAWSADGEAFSSFLTELADAVCRLLAMAPR